MQIRRHPLDIIQLIPKRKSNSYKGTYGRTLIIAGSSKYTGAADLAVEAALRSGTGLVYVAAIHDVAQVVRVRSPEAIVIELSEINGMIDPLETSTITDCIIDHNIDSICIGPGLGQLKAQSEFYKNIISVITSHGIPTLIDADALPEVFSELSMRKYEGNQFVLTPHPKEFLQMIGKDTVSDDIKKEVMSACKKVSQVIVYKTNRTLVCDSSTMWISTTGNSALATAGSGDVLSGLITGLMAQGVTNYEAAKLGVYIHGLAAEIGANKLGLRSFLARNCCEYISHAFQELIQDHDH